MTDNPEPTALYDAPVPRNRVVRCRQCTGDNHETLTHCGFCGHDIRLDRESCLCPKCLREGERHA